MRNLTNNTSLEDVIYDLRNEDNKEELALWLENNVEEKRYPDVSYDDGYDQGHEDGYEEAMEEAKSEHDDMIDIYKARFKERLKNVSAEELKKIFEEVFEDNWLWYES